MNYFSNVEISTKKSKIFKCFLASDLSSEQLLVLFGFASYLEFVVDAEDTVPQEEAKEPSDICDEVAPLVSVVVHQLRVSPAGKTISLKTFDHSDIPDLVNTLERRGEAEGSSHPPACRRPCHQ